MNDAKIVYIDPRDLIPGDLVCTLLPGQRLEKMAIVIAVIRTTLVGWIVDPWADGIFNNSESNKTKENVTKVTMLISTDHGVPIIKVDEFKKNYLVKKVE